MKILVSALLLFLCSIQILSAEYRTIPYTSPEGLNQSGNGQYNTRFMQSIDNSILYVQFTSSPSLYTYQNGEWAIFASYDSEQHGAPVLKVVKNTSGTYIATAQGVYKEEGQSLSLIELPATVYDLTTIQNYDSHDRTIRDISSDRDGKLLILARFNLNGQTGQSPIQFQLNEAFVVNDKTIEKHWRAHFLASDILNDVSEIPYISSAKFIRSFNDGIFVVSALTKPAVSPIAVHYDGATWNELPFNSPSVTDGFKLSDLLFCVVEEDQLWINHYQSNPNIGLLFRFDGSDWRSIGNSSADEQLPQELKDHEITFRPININIQGNTRYICTFGHGLVIDRDNTFSFEPIVSDETSEPYIIQQIEFIGDEIWMRTGGFSATSGNLYKLQNTTTSVEESDGTVAAQILSSEYFNILGKALSAESIRAGQAYLRLDTYSDGKIVVHKLVKS